MKEVFYVKDSVRDEMLVTVVMTDRIKDFITVEHNGQSYDLLWNPAFCYYQGKVGGADGFML